MKIVLKNIILLIFSSLVLASWVSSPQTITVYAGQDMSICENEDVDLASLGAYITGDVTDGTWFTTGDGYFLPSNQSNVIFSIGTIYVPGTSDVTNGEFDLILVSDDPDGNGPLVEQSDMVHISFLTVQAPACLNNLNLSLDENCEQLLQVDMLINNPFPPYDKYIIKCYDVNNNLIPDNLLTGEYLGQTITFSVEYSCTGISCWGTLNIKDYNPPVFQCETLYQYCGDDLSPEVIGFPIPDDALPVFISGNNYEVDNWDACGVVNLSFTEQITMLPQCQSQYDKLVSRVWTAIDIAGNQATCNQSIYIIKKTLQDVILPPNYNGTDQAVIECGSNYPTNSNGYPDISFTGSPETFGCSNLEATYTDTPFPQCGNSLKLVRNWFVIDWCTYESYYHNQIIKIADTQAPTIECPDDVIIYTESYECISGLKVLPVAIVSEDCSSYSMAYALENGAGEDYNDYISVINGLVSLDELPFDTYTFHYIATDDCGNSNNCSINVEIVDNKVPFAICDQYTSVTLGADGIGRLFANSLDDGSFDNCGIDFMKVAKMDDLCGWGTDFGDYVEFCCAEAGTSQMVALQVTDIHGLSNTCMVTVLIEEKLPPKIYCPSDLTISCDFIFDYNDLSVFGTVRNDISEVEPIIINDTYNNGAAGFDGYIEDNCQASVSESYTENISCFEGTITRKFVVQDPTGNKDSCFQTITIVNLSPFGLTNITWPSNYEGVGCAIENIDTEISGEPQFSNEQCALVEATYDDEVFYITDNSCLKILRKWTVIEWCQFDQGIAALWQHTQTIKINNHVKPIILNPTQDSIVCNYAADCGVVKFDYTILASDDCTLDSELLFDWKLDINADGVVEREADSSHILMDLPMGEHALYYFVEDKCGNLTKDTLHIEVKDCKAPTPYCESSITTSLMDTLGEITVFAEQFNIGSYDNCTPVDKLKISFSKNVNDVSRTFTCDDISNGIAGYFNLEMWVTDLEGNQDYCLIEFIVQDNADVCPDNGSGQKLVSGSVFTKSGKPVSGVDVFFEAFDTSFNQKILTNSDGIYIAEVLAGLPYYVNASNNTPAREGLSTLDIVLTQRHILKLGEFTDPLKVIAADVNASNSVTASDLIAMRKVVLNLDTTFANNPKSWVFVDKEQVFPDTLRPWDYTTRIPFASNDSLIKNIDFYGVKLGDVNYDWKQETLSKSDDDNRNESIEILKYKSHDDQIAFFAEQNKIFGFQLSLNTTNTQPVEVESNIEGLEIYASQNKKLVNIIGIAAEGIEISLNDELFHIFGCSGEISINDHSLNPEIYDLQTIKKLTLEKIEENVTEKEKNSDKYFYESGNNLVYRGQSVENAEINLYTTDGQLIFHVVGDFQNGTQIPKNNILSGIYIITIEKDSIKHSQKIFLY
ncbi:MAG: T9SS type A sorting domain-containing protein [Saprospiraceae bacterium]|nr:T9SS type A sorting domain-containing protein [Saprospiraceae bacterium]